LDFYFPEDFRDGVFEFGRKAVLRPLDGKHLVASVRLTSSPWPVRDRAKLDEPIASCPKVMAVEARHISLDAIQPPTGKSVAIGGQREKQVQPHVCRLHSLENAFAANAMIDPRERPRHLAKPLRHEHGQRFSTA
jgi:hypothetical protein